MQSDTSHPVWSSGVPQARSPAPARLILLLVCAMAALLLWMQLVMTKISGERAAAMVAAEGALLILFYRKMRHQHRAILVIQEALLSVAAGERDLAALNVDAALGPEAEAWNQIIAENAGIRKAAAGERARQALDRRTDSRGKIDSACDVLSQGVILIDDHCRVSYANGAASAFLQCRHEDLCGADLTQRIKSPEVVTALNAVNAGGQRGRQIIDIERKDNDVTAVLRFIIRPVRRGDSGSAMVIIDDITQQRAAEEARHRFVAQATHELRTPLTNIRLYVETAIDDGEKDPALRAKCLNVINSETRRLERIVGDMLSVSEIDAGSFKLHCDDVRLDTLIDSLRDDYQQQAQEKKISLVFQRAPKLPVLHADRDKILLAMHNLLSNALKYTPDGGKVEFITSASDSQLAIQVRDTGIGISSAEVDRIFERFYRARDPRVAKLTGTGLGLTLAREVVRLHGGDITVDSRLNEGSTFTMTLPVEEKAAA